jgi:putative peptidoglycan lipid II flippase
MQNPRENSANQQIARAALTVMITFVFAKLVGLLANLLLARSFGTSGEVDAYLAANRFSETLFNLVAGGALASAFIPTFTTLLTQDDRRTAWRLSSAVANLVLLVLTGLGILGWIFAPWVVENLLTPGFEDPAQLALTAELLRIQLPSAVIFGLSGLLMGILNAHQMFLFPALAPSLYPLGVIFGITLLAPRLGIQGAAWGVVIGASLHLLVQAPQILRLPQRKYSPSLGLGLPAVREVLKLMGPRLIGVAVVQLNFWINTLIASHQPEGSLAFIQWGFMLMIMPQAAIAQSIAIAALPTFSAQVARGKPEEMRASLATTLRSVLLLSIPAALGLILLRRPLVALIFQGGAFTAQSTEMVAWSLLWYAAGLVGHCVVEVVSRAFYALHDTRTPVIVGVLTMLLNIILSLAFWGVFNWLRLPPHGALALANSTATAIEMVILLMLMRRRLKGIEGNAIMRVTAAAAAASLGMAGALWLWMSLAWQQPNWLLVGVGMIIGGTTYAGLLTALRVREIRQGWSWLTARFSPRTN